MESQQDAGDASDTKSTVNQIGERDEIHVLQQRFKKGETETIALGEYKHTDFEPTSVYALVSTQKFKENGYLDQTSLKINSPSLLKVFRHIVGYHPTCPEGFEAPFEMHAPFMMLFHHWEDLEAYKNNASEDEKAHLGLLLEYMQGEMGKQRSDIANMIKNHSITFDTLWAIFKREDVMFKSTKGHACFLKLDKTLYEEDPKTGRRFEVHCTHTINDGTGIWRRIAKTTIMEKEHLGGRTSARIDSLPVFPLWALGDSSVLEEDLEKRGQRAKSLTGIATMRYNGAAQYEKEPPSNWFHPDIACMPPVWISFNETGRIVLDGKTYLEDHTSESNNMARSWPDEYELWAEARFGSLERANLILCAPYLYGYSLQKKKWCRFFVDHIEDVKWNENAAESLVLGDKQKALLQALVASHQFAENPREQLEQKGKGLVMLLHGTPGSGKTLTAEVAAEISKSALLTISLGELYEYNCFEEGLLRMYLQYATTWKAVVLIDEADVFLEARTSGSSAGQAAAQRNSLVAVFLRYLEYFSGIMFLTSNRVEDFDSAMKSRIHLALQYSPPTELLRRKIWLTRLRALPADVLGFDMDVAVGSLVSDDMNGREIANTINTALTLARHQRQKLQLEHLETVMEVWREFNANLERLKSEQKAKPRQDAFVTTASKEEFVVDRGESAA